MTKKEMKEQTERTLSVLFEAYHAAHTNTTLHSTYAHISGVLSTLWNLELISDQQYDTLSGRNYNLFVETANK